MASLNSFDFTGRLGRDPELRSTQSGTEMCGFSVAVDRYGDKPTLWVDVTVFGKGAPLCVQYLGKGSEVAVHGQVDEVATFEKRDGGVGVSLRVSTRDVTFLGSKSDGESNGAPRSDLQSEFRPQPVPVGSGGQAMPDDDIPFGPSVI